MLNTLLFAQSYSYSYSTSSSGGSFPWPLFITIMVIALLLAALLIVSMWKVFQKAGRAGWEAIVPFYNMWVLFEISGKPGWWSLVSLGGIVPILGFVAAIAYIVLTVMSYIDLSKKFGKSGGFAALLVLLPFIGFPILAFGKAQYDGNGAAGGSGAGANGSPAIAPTPNPMSSVTSPTQSAAPNPVQPIAPQPSVQPTLPEQQPPQPPTYPQ